MSRIGKLPITVPSGVDIAIEGQDVTVKGPKGTLSHTIVEPLTVERSEAGELLVNRPNDERLSWGAFFTLNVPAFHVALVLQDLRYALLDLASRHGNIFVERRVGVAQTRQHVCDRIGHRHDSFTLSRRGFRCT